VTIINPGLNRPYEALPDHQNIRTAHGWTPWWVAMTHEGQDADQPEFKPLEVEHHPERVLEGDASQCWFIRWRIMSGGIRQCVRVGAGKRVVLRVPFHVWCSQSDNPQADDGELYVRVGIDSHGRTDPRADDVVWSNWVRGTNDWTAISLSTIAEADEVTLYVQGWNKWSLSHNDVYVDDIEFEVEGEEPGPSPDVVRVEVTGPDGGPVLVRIESPSLLDRLRAFFR